MGERSVQKQSGLPPRLITAGAVAYFALLGLALRVAIAAPLSYGHADFGITTTEPQANLSASARRCHLRSSGSGYFLQNILGCVLMAVVARHKSAMNEHLATGLSSGLCGSLTTFATWMGEVAKTVRNGDVFQALVSVICMLCVSLCSYRLGHFMAGCGMGDEPACFDDLCGLRHLCCGKRGGAAHPLEDPDSSSDSSSEDLEAEAAAESGAKALENGAAAAGHEGEPDDWGLAADRPSTWHEEEIKDVRLHPAMERSIVAFSLACVVLYAGLCAGLRYYDGLFHLAFAPLGALLRWYLSLLNAPAQKACFGVPVFTLVANLLGCACSALTEGLAMDAGRLHTWLLKGVGTGCAGSLSTVSTFIGELRSDAIGGLGVRVVYILLSFGLAMAIELPIQNAFC